VGKSFFLPCIRTLFFSCSPIFPFVRLFFLALDRKKEGMNNAARQQGVSPHYSRTSPDSGIYASGLCCWKGIPVGYWLFPDSVLEAQDRQDKGSLVSVLPGSR